MVIKGNLSTALFDIHTEVLKSSDLASPMGRPEEARLEKGNKFKSLPLYLFVN